MYCSGLYTTVDLIKKIIKIIFLSVGVNIIIQIL